MIPFGERSSVEGQSSFPSFSCAHPRVSSASTPGTPEGCDACETGCRWGQRGGKLKLNVGCGRGGLPQHVL